MYETFSAQQAGRPVVAGFRRILVPIDGSEAALRAFAAGVRLARACAAELLALHAIPPRRSMIYLAEWAAHYSEQAIASASAYFARAQALAAAAQVPCRCHYAFGGAPYEAILQAIPRHRCDLVVMAARGRQASGGPGLGGTARKVALESGVPVLVCR